jgi:hypothetical protein
LNSGSTTGGQFCSLVGVDDGGMRQCARHLQGITKLMGDEKRDWERALGEFADVNFKNAQRTQVRCELMWVYPSTCIRRMVYQFPFPAL